uniref:Uncharacterized protein n=1 Tax=Cacopsylla melanoneura TaxID=428564 RepID=A0A8D8TUD6_9HEMI
MVSQDWTIVSFSLCVFFEISFREHNFIQNKIISYNTLTTIISYRKFYSFFSRFKTTDSTEVVLSPFVCIVYILCTLFHVILNHIDNGRLPKDVYIPTLFQTK